MQLKVLRIKEIDIAKEKNPLKLRRLRSRILNVCPQIKMQQEIRKSCTPARHLQCQQETSNKPGNISPLRNRRANSPLKALHKNIFKIKHSNLAICSEDIFLSICQIHLLSLFQPSVSRDQLCMSCKDSEGAGFVCAYGWVTLWLAFHTNLQRKKHCG